MMTVGCQGENDSDMLSVNVGNQLEVVDEFCCLGSFLALSRSNKKRDHTMPVQCLQECVIF